MAVNGEGRPLATAEVDYQAIIATGRIELASRLSPERYAHSLAVADTAAEIAKLYGVDTDKARAAGLLHDWDKDLSDQQLMARAEEYRLDLQGLTGGIPALLHAQTGARAVAERFSELPGDVIQAIARHSQAAPDMNQLDMVIYIADAIEPGRCYGNLDSLRTLVGQVELRTLFFKAFEATLTHLIERHRLIEPGALAVWNAYVALERAEC
ncbi:MAG: bis(5'-nucleosyl)-tetraphosphatase (symmetrical) YqeK [Actinomycetia bacterium]|nr:bis(5'-nucleosyl)-tetraphosphatase (symmetrical) YqeK [Actinomycetes bacterium]